MPHTYLLNASTRADVLIRWALGLHGLLHVSETVLNVYERAYYSAVLSLLSSLVMFSGALIARHHDRES